MKRITVGSPWSSFLVRDLDARVLGILRTEDPKIHEFLVNHHRIGKRIEGMHVEPIDDAVHLLVEHPDEILDAVKVLISVKDMKENPDR